jgi:hypothetical protein
MAFTLTYTDGQESYYDDETKWEVEGGVLKLGREDGQWSVYVSPGHWATIEVGKSGGDTKEKKHTRTTTEAQTSIRDPMITVRSRGSLK